MEKDLFGRKIRRRKSKLEKILEKYDKKTLDERVERLELIQKIIPKGYTVTGSVESAYIFDETKMTFLNGEFISTILLSQAFIERKFQEMLMFRGYEKESRMGLFKIIDFLKKNKSIDGFILNKIEKLRNRRNPFAHLKTGLHEFNLLVRSNYQTDKIYKIMENDAKEAIELMYYISHYSI